MCRRTESSWGLAYRLVERRVRSSQLSPVRAQGMAPGSPPCATPSASATDHSPPLAPPNSWAWKAIRAWKLQRPIEFGGPAAFGEAIDGDGDGNGSRELTRKLFWGFVMQDRQLYAQILGITSPWSVDRVELELNDGDVDVYLTHDVNASWCCPECGLSCPLHDHEPLRAWRHLDTCQYRTMIHAAVPRTKCPEHGVRTVRVPWAEPNSRFTSLFERLAIGWMLEAGRSATARRMQLSWDQADGIMQRAIERGLARREEQVVTRIGVDEKSFQHRHEYVTTVCDLDRGHVLYVGDHRRQTTLEAFYEQLTPEQLNGIEAVAMDMWDPYIAATRKHVPDADNKIVFDRFHVSKHLNEAVDKVRRQEHKQLRSVDDDRLKGTKYSWLRSPHNFTCKSWREFGSLRKSTLRTARGWAIKEMFRDFWEYTYAKSAEKFFMRWHGWAVRSRLKPIKDVATMLKRRFANLITYFKHPITNAMSESLNAKIQWIKYTAHGFRSREGFRRAIYFHCGGLDLYPR